MSNHSSQDVSEKKKRDVWQEAGSEFYQESYPSGSGQEQQGNHRKSSRHNIPLPSQTARRNSYAYSRTRNTTYGRSGTVNAYTFTSTGIGTATVTHEIQVSVLPDLADMTIPNERKRWEELHKIKSMPISMAAKRELKAQLTTIPMLKLKGWKRFRWLQQRFMDAVKTGWTKRMRNLNLMKRSLQHIESRCGTSILNVFHFIKWTAFLNFWICVLIALFLILPVIIGVEKAANSINETCPLDFNSSVPLNPSSSWNSDPLVRTKQISDCCTESYHELNDKPGQRTSFGRAVIELLIDSNEMTLQYSPLVYGFYPAAELQTESLSYNYAIAYALAPVVVFTICMIVLIPQIGAGIRELIAANEGEFYNYSTLIFSGWDHYTKEEAGAKFKKKLLKHEMKVALKTEKLKLKATLRTRKQKLKVYFVRAIANLLVISLQIVAGVIICNVTQFCITETLKCEDCGGTTLLEGTTTEVDLRRVGIRLLPSFSIAILNMGFPVLLRQIGRLEKYSPSVQMSWDLLRTLIARLMSVAFAAYQFYTSAFCAKLEGTCTFCDHIAQEAEPIQKSACWESVLGEQLYLLIAVDFVIKLIVVFVIDAGRRLIGYYIPLKACKRLGRMKFNVARHSMDIVYVQFLAWFFYFAPFIPFVATLYCILLFYMKKFTVLVTCRAVPDTHRTIRTRTTFAIAKLISLAAAAVVIGRVLCCVQPSRGCGPFRELGNPWGAVQKLYADEDILTLRIIKTLLSPLITIPILVLLFLIAYYYFTVTRANRSMVETLRHLLILEGHDKQYLFARLNTLRKQSVSSLQASRLGTTVTIPED